MLFRSTASARQMGRCRHPRAGTRFQGPARIDPAHLRRDGRMRQPDRSRARGRSGPSPVHTMILSEPIKIEGIGDDDAGGQCISATDDRHYGHQSASQMQVLSAIGRLTAHFVIRAYQLTLSSIAGSHCRHLPTCSAYMDEAIARHGLWAGGAMGIARLLRCHPWGTSGFDPVPKTLPSHARWWRPWTFAARTGDESDKG